MNCRTTRRHLDAYLDGEVDPTTQIEFEQHFAICAGCQEILDASQRLKSATRAAVSSTKAPAGLEGRIATMLAKAPPSRREPVVRVFTLPSKYAIPAAAAATLAFMAGGWFGPYHGGAATTEQASAMPLFQDVVRLHSTQLPADVSNPQREQLTSWFRDKVEFPVRSADFAGEPDVHLLGARLSNIGSRRAAALYYDVHGHRMTIVAFPGSQPISGLRDTSVQRIRGKAIVYQRVGGYTVSTVEHDGVTYAITGDMDTQTLLRLASMAQLH